MFIVLLDEQGLFVYSSAEEAAADIELPDAHREVRAAFDETGMPFKPDREVVETRWTVEVAQYRWVPAGPAQPAALLALLENFGKNTEPTSAHNPLQNLVLKLRAQ